MVTDMDATIANTKRLRHSIPVTVEPAVDESYWIEAEARDLEDRADNFCR